MLVNGLGSTTLLEQYLVHRKVADVLKAREIAIHHSGVGEYCTSFEMAGGPVPYCRPDGGQTDREFGKVYHIATE
ncbi:MAG: dihydroxyacetone kinase subunit DhaK [Pseudomonadota bacterium]